MNCADTALLDRTESKAPNRKIDAEYKKPGASYLFLKRCFDLISSFCAVVVLLIPMLVIAIIIMIKDFGSPFYWQVRVGQNGKDFGMLKFRSMHKGADRLEDVLTPEQLEQYKKEYKLDDDPRLLGYERAGDGSRCFGAIIRRTSLDELPQILWNILIKGNMSVVGPRPILREELEDHYTKEEQLLLLSVKPGLTGYWQAYARNNASYATGERQRMELYYVSNAGVWLDLKIILATFGAVFFKIGAK